MIGSDNKGSDDQSNLGKLISLKRAAELSGLSQSHLALLARTDELWAIKIARNWVTTELAVREYLARNRRPGPKPK